MQSQDQQLPQHPSSADDAHGAQVWGQQTLKRMLARSCMDTGTTLQSGQVQHMMH